MIGPTVTTSAPSAARACAPQHRADAAAQLGKPERLGDVIVAAGLEAEHGVGLGVERRQHDDRHDVAPGAQRPADLVPVGARAERDVEQDDVEVLGARAVDRLDARPPTAVTRCPSRENERVSISRRSDSSSTTRMLSEPSVAGAHGASWLERSVTIRPRS